jgi:hypothetical protein
VKACNAGVERVEMMSGEVEIRKLMEVVVARRKNSVHVFHTRRGYNLAN